MLTDDLDILARTIYGEARGEYSAEGGLAAYIAVANVVMNRMKFPHIFGKTIQEVCQKPRQFSCWNPQDPNHGILSQHQINDSLFLMCCEVAGKVMAGQWPDLTKGSDHYHANYLCPIPIWARGVVPKVRIAKHIFYQLMKGA